MAMKYDELFGKLKNTQLLSKASHENVDHYTKKILTVENLADLSKQLGDHCDHSLIKIFEKLWLKISSKRRRYRG